MTDLDYGLGYLVRLLTLFLVLYIFLGNRMRCFISLLLMIENNNNI